MVSDWLRASKCRAWRGRLSLNRARVVALAEVWMDPNRTHQSRVCQDVEGLPLTWHGIPLRFLRRSLGLGCYVPSTSDGFFIFERQSPSTSAVTRGKKRGRWKDISETKKRRSAPAYILDHHQSFSLSHWHHPTLVAQLSDADIRRTAQPPCRSRKRRGRPRPQSHPSACLYRSMDLHLTRPDNGSAA
ncbi:hypothetical protein N657DRAFT_504967 [Parathielavia appendiculata]|uniref:Uncharacterized protein n=1 Tax=Parathielavia appendiculata TaxID=2587402 RepID=A0AAN6TYF7_9PEZI|nr:hypothetical protein N657DRAFT_504967 [Parathielavia appendiculata]